MKRLFGRRELEVVPETEPADESAESLTPGPELLREGTLLAAWFVMYQLDYELERARRHERPLSVVLLTPVPTLGRDLDPDTLERAVTAARSVSRSTDLLGSLAEGRIIIVMPETDKDGAAAAISRWKDEMSRRARLTTIRWIATSDTDPCAFSSATELVLSLTGESGVLADAA